MAQSNDVLTLIYEKTSQYDSDGFASAETTLTRNIFCYTKSVRQTEYYEGTRNGIKCETVFVVHPFEFYVEDTEGNQFKPNKLLHNGIYYRVVRPYQKGFGELELTCEVIE